MRNPVAFVLVMAAGVVMAAQGTGTGPSFDCARASGQVEQLVCKDAELAGLDRRLAATYAAALANWPANIAAEQRATQRGWIRGRDECWKASDVRACVVDSYQTRIVELQIKSGQIEAPSAVGFQCAGAENKPFFATFYKETEPPSVVLTFGDDQVIAFIARSGSGARYTAANVEYWEHQGEASVEWFGTRLTCRPLAPGGQGVGATARQPLGGTSWRVVRFQSMDDSTLDPGSAQFTLSFEAEGGLRVVADCNRGTGTWRSTDNVTLALGPVALTRAMCPPNPLRDRFVRDLGDVRSTSRATAACSSA
ncbi:MAG: MliC family protein [Vicinamibacterales bacterium]